MDNTEYNCIAHNDDREWRVGEVMTHPLNDYELKLREKQSNEQHYFDLSTGKYSSISKLSIELIRDRYTHFVQNFCLHLYTHALKVYFRPVDFTNC